MKNNQYTCTFPKFKYKILTARTKMLKAGDVYNFCHPIGKSVDYWSEVTNDKAWDALSHNGWVFIRPI